MTDLWTPSDDLLRQDPIALQKLQTPFDPPDLEAQGIKLFDVEDDAANEAAACIVLASLDDDDVPGDEPGESDDDDAIEDPEDDGHLSADV
ncbi:MAG: hypothetical protein QOJ63_2685 [Solirubrobacteraceae bacterium]|jgi:hypothetical protein|nr:hypothetical protein [Solirubrobacteraceae bacterium]